VVLHRLTGTLAQITKYPVPVSPADAFFILSSEDSLGNWQLEIKNEDTNSVLINGFSIDFCTGKTYLTFKIFNIKKKIN
jgi:hypothetical protein